jgi:tetratricopeptide (TPR) repeat protein
MPEPERLESLSSPESAARDSRAESLLVEGLDQYFAGRYDDAIHIWTRVLFLDRTHSRARAYIDRARTALAERQRRADELLEASYELLGQGRTTAARHLFDEVIAQAGEDERAAALRLRLERLEQFERLSATPPRGIPKPAASTPVTKVDVRATWPRRRVVSLVGGLVVLAFAAGIFISGDARSWLGWQPTSPDLATHLPVVAPPPLSASEVALIRARTAVGRGRFAEALRDLDRVSADSPMIEEADRMRAGIQKTLMEARVQ